ncbi:hypothetical protein [Mesorhizobium sp. KR2-14]|uniref:hypothetical protein n=1 Tax=Mesorhizobium sp. KR2-14 TaxID=3156610 RepID=UPI0032B3A60E
MDQFLKAAVGGKFRFGIDPADEITVRIRTGTMFCWSCGAETRIVTVVQIVLGGKEFLVTIPSLGEYPQPAEMIRDRVSSHHSVGPIKERSSRAQGRRYLSNGCAHCDSLIGQFHELDAVWDDEPVDAFRVPVSHGWKEVLDSCGWKDIWWVRS